MPSRNAESHFALLPKNQMERSKFKIEHTHKTTFNAAQLIPFFIEQDVLPGDTFSIDTSFLIRMTTPMKPTMDNCYADIYYFAVPNRLVWQHWKDFMGENRNGAWTQLTQYTVPQLTTPTGGASTGTIMDYMGIPIGIANLSFSALPFRAYTLIYNEWFRDQNLQAPLTEYTDDTNRTASNTTPELGGLPVNVFKYHDYFTSALPEPQKGSAITMPLGTTAPVIGDGKALGLTDGTSVYSGLGGSNGNGVDRLNAYTGNYGVNVGTTSTGALPSINAFGVTTDTTKSGLIADLTQATAATINALRLSFATQRILEKDARGGTRYTEVIKNHFNVTSPDARQQRPEYLGGERVPININQVLQTSSTDSTSPQGNTGAWSMTGNINKSFTKSFTEHSIIIGLICVRQDHTYQQGLERSWSRKHRLDYYWPSLAHLGEQPIYNKEIYAQGTSADDQVFGYQERWAEYRYKPSRISGELRSTYATPLDVWHYGDKYNSLPVLSSAFLQETPDYIDRTIEVAHTLQNQFIADFFVDITAVRPMPIYSVPGLIDHF